jgi:hypothetical protein
MHPGHVTGEASPGYIVYSRVPKLVSVHTLGRDSLLLQQLTAFTAFMIGLQQQRPAPSSAHMHTPPPSPHSPPPRATLARFFPCSPKCVRWPSSGSRWIASGRRTTTTTSPSFHPPATPMPFPGPTRGGKQSLPNSSILLRCYPSDTICGLSGSCSLSLVCCSFEND